MPRSGPKTELAELVEKLGGPTAVIRAFEFPISESTLGRWTKDGTLTDFAAGLELMRLHGGSPKEQIAFGRRIARRPSTK